LNLKELSTKFNLQTKFVTGNSKIFGWQSESVVFNNVIEEIKPKTIIEIGSWVGASAIHMAKCLKANNINDFQILCVDTFLGSNASLWIENFINVDNVFQEQYNQFNINVTNSGFNENISALPMTSSSAAELCQILNVQVDLIYIDAGHQEKEVYDDLNDWWPISTKMVFGDDYSETWSGVKKAVNRFVQEKNINFQEKDSKFILRH
jgi:hypothetical protein